MKFVDIQFSNDVAPLEDLRAFAVEPGLGRILQLLDLGLALLLDLRFLLARLVQ